MFVEIGNLQLIVPTLLYCTLNFRGEPDKSNGWSYEISKEHLTSGWESIRGKCTSFTFSFRLCFKTTLVYMKIEHSDFAY